MFELGLMTVTCRNRVTHGIADTEIQSSRARGGLHSRPRAASGRRGTMHAASVSSIAHALRPAASVRVSSARARAPPAAHSGLVAKAQPQRSAFVSGARRVPSSLARRAPRSRAALSVAAAAPAAAVTATMTSLQFTPVHALCGGALLGIASIAKLALTGRVLGVSESFKRPLTGDVRGSDAAFLAGLLFAGAMHTAISGGVAAMPHEPMVPLAQVALAGFLVGVGSSLGNGCTSGHGICGNARLSPRSMAYTCVFMLFGFGAATLAGTNAALGIAEASALRNVAYPAAASVAHWAALAAAAVAAFAALGFLASGSRGSSTARTLAGKTGNAGLEPLLVSESDSVGATTNAQNVQRRLPSARQKKLDVVSDFVIGAIFGAGLVVSGMIHPAKVSGFLSATSAAWDPSLALVMGGALALCVPGFALVRKTVKSPACAADFSTPTATRMDAKLAVGGMCFGIGWGIGGICPGPAVVALASGVNPLPVAAWLAAMVAGIAADKRLLGPALA